MLLASALGLIILVLSHIFVDKLNLALTPRNIWLSAAGGISVSYIFIHVLPELQKWQELMSNKSFFIKHELYLFSLLGLIIFYGLERAAKLSGLSQRSSSEGAGENKNIFWVHIFSFGVYNLLIGYLLTDREEQSFKSFSFFVIAMAFHFLGNDFALLDHYQKKYKKKGRWIVTIAILAGWIIGILTEIPKIYIGFIFAFIAGALIINVLKEELPEERKSNYWFFMLGAALYSFLLII